jgi:FdhE protein
VTTNTETPSTLRVRRARHLANVISEASELLTFYAGLTTLQQSLVGPHAGAQPAVATLQAGVDRDAVVTAIPRVLDWLRRDAPPDLAAAAERLQASTSGEWRAWLDAVLAGARDVDPHHAFVVEAALQPFAERLAAAFAAEKRASDEVRPQRCPLCGQPPGVATLREAGHGARRALVCGRCQIEWPFTRIGCPSCGETEFDRLPVFSADSMTAARVDACDACRGYIKSIDLTRDGHAVPAVDDLATVALDLWAQEQGYQRLRPHLLRL